MSLNSWDLGKWYTEECSVRKPFLCNVNAFNSLNQRRPAQVACEDTRSDCTIKSCTEDNGDIRPLRDCKKTCNVCTSKVPFKLPNTSICPRKSCRAIGNECLCFTGDEKPERYKSWKDAFEYTEQATSIPDLPNKANFELLSFQENTWSCKNRFEH